MSMCLSDRGRKSTKRIQQIRLVPQNAMAFSVELLSLKVCQNIEEWRKVNIDQHSMSDWKTSTSRAHRSFEPVAKQPLRSLHDTRKQSDSVNTNFVHEKMVWGIRQKAELCTVVLIDCCNWNWSTFECYMYHFWSQNFAEIPTLFTDSAKHIEITV